MLWEITKKQDGKLTEKDIKTKESIYGSCACACVCVCTRYEMREKLRESSIRIYDCEHSIASGEGFSGYIPKGKKEE